MTTSTTDDASLLEQYRTPMGIGLISVVIAAFLLVQGTTFDGSPTNQPTALQKPPMPTTEVRLAKNKLIKQEAVNLDATLNLSTSERAVTASRDE